MEDYDWPGNVREFKNFIESMVIFHEGDEIEVADLPPEFRLGYLASTSLPVQNVVGAPSSSGQYWSHSCEQCPSG